MFKGNIRGNLYRGMLRRAKAEAARFYEVTEDQVEIKVLYIIPDDPGPTYDSTPQYGMEFTATVKEG